MIMEIQCACACTWGPLVPTGRGREVLAPRRGADQQRLVPEQYCRNTDSADPVCTGGMIGKWGDKATVHGMDDALFYLKPTMWEIVSSIHHKQTGRSQVAPVAKAANNRKLWAFLRATEILLISRGGRISLPPKPVR